MNIIPYSEYPYKNGYLEKILYPQYQNVFPPKLVVSGMIDWKNEEDASFWAGAWNLRYVGCRVEDFSLTINLPTVVMVNEHEKKYNYYNLFNINSNVFIRIFKNHPDFPKQVIHPYYFIISTKDGQKCSRTELTEEEVLYFLSHATKKEIIFREKNIEKANSNLNWYKKTVTKQFPVKIYLFGDDDCSYTKLCPNVELAIQIINNIIQNPNSLFICKEFVFTN